ncbi:hypothetical protein BWI96_20385 [Siphonobacter sp. SORGH_AS_0500]|uniref:DUF6600 domain-containing protein n=1 Tax=Siphonobacter sp. SORGH_AS_0500 TaxID=1864824 RepID=UPI000CAE1ED4|nr:DUF6600 domain-containing protein [Siphonobacter sp. SORGH_AS_0500]PKK34812.1 hypothetical protein BWI96_20385 [Siphonobacter sp. SORGH_AS_0500]
MKTSRIIALVCLLTTGLGIASVQAQPGVNISFATFYNELSPYGEWIQNPEYGQVWSPNVDPGFQPYGTAGRWEMTEYGNTWVSDYPWGWAPFHYGRWVMAYNRWVWVPDYEWGPAWVNWRNGGGYYGWAPLGPGMNINVNINLPWNYWVFVPRQYLLSPRIYSYCVPRTRVVNIYNNTTIINNVYQSNNRTYVSGPNRRDIQRATGRPVDVRRADDFGRRVGFYNRDYTSNRGDRNGNWDHTNGGNWNRPGDRDNTPNRPDRNGTPDYQGNRRNNGMNGFDGTVRPDRGGNNNTPWTSGRNENVPNPQPGQESNNPFGDAGNRARRGWNQNPGEPSTPNRDNNPFGDAGNRASRGWNQNSGEPSTPNRDNNLFGNSQPSRQWNPGRNDSPSPTQPGRESNNPFGGMSRPDRGGSPDFRSNRQPSMNQPSAPSMGGSRIERNGGMPSDGGMRQPSENRGGGFSPRGGGENVAPGNPGGGGGARSRGSRN